MTDFDMNEFDLKEFEMNREILGKSRYFLIERLCKNPLLVWRIVALILQLVKTYPKLTFTKDGVSLPVSMDVLNNMIEMHRDACDELNHLGFKLSANETIYLEKMFLECSEKDAKTLCSDFSFAHWNLLTPV